MSAEPMVIGPGWNDLAPDRLMGEVLRRFVPGQRWFGAKDRTIANVRVIRSAEFPGGSESAAPDGWRLLVVEIALADGTRQEYFLPLGLAWPNLTGSGAGPQSPSLVAPVRREQSAGTLYDATSSPAFVRAAIKAMGAGIDLAGRQGGVIEFRATPALGSFILPDAPRARPASGEQSNTCVFVETQLIFKAYRRLVPGVHPEIEMMAFLTARAPQVAIPALLGTIQWYSAERAPTAVGLLMEQVTNRGDAWTVTLAHLAQSFAESRRAPERGPAAGGWHAGYLPLAAQIGRRTAELHRALCPDHEPDPAFHPEPIADQDLAEWRAALLAQAEAVFSQLTGWVAAHAELGGKTAEEVRRLMELAPVARGRAERLKPGDFAAVKTRYHGDLHLGQMLVKGDDVVIIDFEGEPRRTLAERRSKNSVLKDVAGVIRSFDYAAAAASLSAPGLSAAEREAFEPFCAEWRQLAVQTFLQEYCRQIDGCAVWPRDEAAALEILEFYILEKALYEVGYELANRPQWVGIPVRALINLLAR